MTLHLHHLKGCAPAPLAHYLKALGIFRLIVEQGADREARGWWQDEHFHLLTRLTRDEIEAFFLEKYAPTPLLSPWNKGSGFFKEKDPGLDPLESSKAPRFAPFREGVAEARRLIEPLSNADAAVRAIKARTKTDRSFQSDEEREILKRSGAFRLCLDALSNALDKPDLEPRKRAELEDEALMVRSLIAPTAKRPTKTEAEHIKKHSGYKRFLAIANRQFESLKAAFIPGCRRSWRGPHANWLSAAVVLPEDGDPAWPSLLGTGGNDGRLDFTNNFMQRLDELFDISSCDDHSMPAAREMLSNSVWSEPTGKLSSGPVGQYEPGAAGGANSTTGPDGDSLINAWDFVLMMEGSLLFTCRATRHLAPTECARASAPFTIRPHAAGFSSPGQEKAQRGEQWMPIWSRPTTLSEVAVLFSEARVQIGRRTANRPIGAAQAIGLLGVSRGIQYFERYGYLERNGQSTLAVPLGRIQVRHRPLVHLIDDVDSWSSRLQRTTRGKHAPARLAQAEGRLANAIFAALTHDPAPDRWQAVLRAAVAIEAIQASGTAIEAGPIPPLRVDWIAATDDGSPEFRLALALGSAAANYSRMGRPFDSARHHWLPLKPGARGFQITEKRLARDQRVVMTGRDMLNDLAALVERRTMEVVVGGKGERRLPLVAARGCGAQLGDLAAFLSGTFDFDKMYELARAFMAVRWDQWRPDYRPGTSHDSAQPDEAWLALRLAMLAWPLATGRNIPAEPGTMRRLRAGDSAGAVDIALRRLRSVGIRPPLQAGSTDPATAQRWAAALAFPIDHGGARRAAVILDPTMKGDLNG